MIPNQGLPKELELLLRMKKKKVEWVMLRRKIMEKEIMVGEIFE